MTPKQKRFVEEYLIDLNATQAAIRAGYSKKTANPQGARLLANVSIKAALKEAQEARSERTEITADDVIKGLLDEARFMDEGTSHSARIAAWAHLGRHLGMFKDKVSLNADESLVQLMWAIDGRTRGLPGA